MAHSSLQTNAIKPITLTILPNVPSQVSAPTMQNPNFNHTPILPIVQSQVSAPTMPNPNFNHTPIAPITIPHPLGITPEEREARRLAKQRERNARYRERVKEYTKLGSLTTDREKIYSSRIS